MDSWKLFLDKIACFAGFHDWVYVKGETIVQGAESEAKLIARYCSCCTRAQVRDFSDDVWA